MLRKRAIDIILRVKHDGAYSNLELAASLNGLNAKEKAFVTRLVYGTLTYEIQADYLLSKHMRKAVSKLDKEVLAILESAVYQKFYMDSVPDYAIINESVKLTRKYGKTSAAGFVNGVLRNTLAAGLDYSDIPENTVKYYSIRYSLDEGFCSLMMEQYGNLAEKIFKGSRESAPFTVRVNTLKTDREKLKDIFLSKGIKTEYADVCDSCLKIRDGFSVKEDVLFAEGMYWEIYDYEKKYPKAKSSYDAIVALTKLCSMKALMDDMSSPSLKQWRSNLKLTDGKWDDGLFLSMARVLDDSEEWLYRSASEFALEADAVYLGFAIQTMNSIKTMPRKIIFAVY